LGVRGQEAVGPVLFDLATQIKAVGEAVFAAPLSNPGTLIQQDLDYLLRQAYVGNRPEEKSTS
jgi:hypothetical protein